MRVESIACHRILRTRIRTDESRSVSGLSMDLPFRRVFNENFSSELYRAYQQELLRRLNCAFEFRMAETPVFFPSDLRHDFVRAAQEILMQLSEPARIRRMKDAIPPAWNTPGMDSLPSIAQIDMAVVRAKDDSLVPRLIELQGFPSLTAFQVFQRDAWVETMRAIAGLDRNWSCWFSGLDRERFIELARRTIVGSHDPAHVILMDLDPPSQKTFPDFAATKILFGIDAVCPTTLVKKGRKLWRRVCGSPDRWIPVERIYNRVVFDELIRKKITLPFDYRDELEVEWVPHPNWFWVWSKYSIPFLDHPAVPRATFLSDLEHIPDDLSSRYVLKPLFSFAGAGVNVEPKLEDLMRIPTEERRSWCLQEKITYEPVLQAADGGGVKIEIRMMFLKPEDEQTPVLAQNLCRLSRGKMMGVDFNKDFTWVGSSVGLWPSDEIR